MKQSELLRTSADLVEAHLSRLEGPLSSLTEAQLSKRPSTGWWSVGQIAEHLLVTHQLYFDKMDKAISSAAKRTSDDDHVPTFVGKLLVKGVGPEANTPAPRAFWPSEHPPADVMSRLKADYLRLKQMIEASADLDLNGAKVASPISKLVKLNLGDVLLMHAIHGERHMRQILELLGPPAR